MNFFEIIIKLIFKEFIGIYLRAFFQHVAPKKKEEEEEENSGKRRKGKRQRNIFVSMFIRIAGLQSRKVW